MKKVIFFTLVSFFLSVCCYAAWDTHYVDNDFSEGDHWIQWYFGCSPTAAGVIMDYWDVRGYSDLMQGNTDDNVASIEHISTWYTANAGVLADPYTNRNSAESGAMTDPQQVTDYTNNSIADFMGSSRGDYSSTHWNSLFAGNSLTDQQFNEEHTPDIVSGLMDYSAYRGYEAYAEFLPYTDDSWDQLTAEIDAGRPVLAFVDIGLDGTADHSVPVFGYRIDGADKEYYFYNLYAGFETGTWNDFMVIQAAQRYSIMGFNIFKLDQSVPEYTATDVVTELTAASSAISVTPGYSGAAGDTLYIRNGASVTINSANKAAIKGNEDRLAYFLTDYTTQLRNYYLNYNDVVQENGSTISTTGNYTPAYAVGNGCDLSVDGAVTTNGMYAHAFMVNGSYNTITIQENALIAPGGAWTSMGVNLDGNSNTVILKGSIQSTNQWGIGVFLNSVSTLNISSTGDITTNSANCPAVYAQKQNNIVISGTIHTQGATSNGVHLLAGNVADIAGTIIIDQTANSYSFYSAAIAGYLKNVVNVRTGASVTGFFANAGLNASAEVNFGGHKNIDGTTTAVDADFEFAYSGRFFGQDWDAYCLGGKTYLNGSVNDFSDLTVYSGASIGGTGTVTVAGEFNNYGTLRPGNAGIGRLILFGDYTHKSGADYEVEIDAATSRDRFTVTGDVTFDGGQIKVAAGTLGAFASVYTNIVSATNLNGYNNIDFISGPLLTVTPTLDGNTIDIAVVSKDFASVAITSSQKNVATIFDDNTAAGGDFDNVLNALKYIETQAGIESAYDDLSAKTVISESAVLSDVSSNVMSMVAGRSHTAVSAVPSNLYFNSDADYYLELGSIWSSAHMIFGDRQTDEQSLGYEYDADMMFWGTDFRVSPYLLFGAAHGIGRTEVEHSNDDFAKIDSEYYSTYLNYSKNNVYFDVVYTYILNSHDTQRYIAFGGLERIAESIYDSKSSSVYFEAGKEIDCGVYSVLPLVSLNYSHFRPQSYTETGAGAMNLYVFGQDVESFETSVGAALRYDIDCEKFEDSYFEFRGRFSRELMDNARVFKGLFSEISSGILEYNGQKKQRNRYSLGCGLALEKKYGWTMSMDYDFSFDRCSVEHVVGLKFKYNF